MALFVTHQSNCRSAYLLPSYTWTQWYPISNGSEIDPLVLSVVAGPWIALPPWKPLEIFQRSTDSDFPSNSFYPQEEHVQLLNWIQCSYLLVFRSSITVIFLFSAFQCVLVSRAGDGSTILCHDLFFNAARKPRNGWLRWYAWRRRLGNRCIGEQLPYQWIVTRSRLTRFGKELLHSSCSPTELSLFLSLLRPRRTHVASDII